MIIKLISGYLDYKIVKIEYRFIVILIKVFYVRRSFGLVQINSIQNRLFLSC